MKDTKTAPLIHSIPTTRHMLGDIGHTKAYDLIGAGKLKRVKIGTRSFITDTSIRAYLRELESAAA